VGAVTSLSRRAFVGGLTGLGASAAGLALVDNCSWASAAHPKKIHRIGYLGDPSSEAWVQALWVALSDLGWVAGQTLTIEARDQAKGEVSALVAELLALPVDLLVTTGTAATTAARRATETIPIVFESVGNPVEVGLVASLARPGGNVTGVSTGASTLFHGKQLELLKSVIPGLQRVAVLADPSNPASTAVNLGSYQASAEVLGIQIQAVEVNSIGDLEAAFIRATEWQAEGLIIRPSPIMIPERARIAQLASRDHLPAMCPFKEFVDAGGMMSYGTSKARAFQRVATYVDQILKGAKPAGLPVEQLTTIQFAVNQKVLQELGMTLPRDVATQVTDWVTNS
jgi:putative ABC transport system substrate-binding protein